MNGNKPATPTDWVDPDDAPELSDDFFARADEFQGSKLVRRDRPPTGMPRKQVTTIRLSPEVMDALQGHRRGLADAHRCGAEGLAEDALAGVMARDKT